MKYSIKDLLIVTAIVAVTLAIITSNLRTQAELDLFRRSLRRMDMDTHEHFHDISEHLYTHDKLLHIESIPVKTVPKHNYFPTQPLYIPDN